MYLNLQKNNLIKYYQLENEKGKIGLLPDEGVKIEESIQFSNKSLKLFCLKHRSGEYIKMKTKNIRSLLFVPAEQSKLQKLNNFELDAFILDLEDSIRKDDKESALKTLQSFLETFDAKGKMVFVRVNADNMRQEIEALQYDCVDGFMLPKFETVGLLEELKDAIGLKKIIALIETPMGVINLSSIAGCRDIWAIAFGAEDYCCQTGTKNAEQYLLPIKTQLVTCAKAYGKKCFDTIMLEFKNQDKMRLLTQESHNIGFDGKLAIHPAQANVINDVYSFQNRDKMEEIVAAFENCETGVLIFEGKIYEKPHIENMKRILENT